MGDFNVTWRDHCPACDHERYCNVRRILLRNPRDFMAAQFIGDRGECKQFEAKSSKKNGAKR